MRSSGCNIKSVIDRLVLTIILVSLLLSPLAYAIEDEPSAIYNIDSADTLVGSSFGKVTPMSGSDVLNVAEKESLLQVDKNGHPFYEINWSGAEDDSEIKYVVNNVISKLPLNISSGSVIVCDNTDGTTQCPVGNMPAVANGSISVEKNLYAGKRVIVNSDVAGANGTLVVTSDCTGGSCNPNTILNTNVTGVDVDMIQMRRGGVPVATHRITDNLILPPTFSGIYAINVNGTDSLIMSPDGRVGIGVLPIVDADKLQVNGRIKASNILYDTASTSNFFGEGAGVGNLGYYALGIGHNTGRINLYDSVILIGNNATATAPNQLVIGDYITNMIVPGNMTLRTPYGNLSSPGDAYRSLVCYTNQYKGDLNNNKAIDPGDADVLLKIIYGVWGFSGNTCCLDSNGDGVINMSDIDEINSNLGTIGYRNRCGDTGWEDNASNGTIGETGSNLIANGDFETWSGGAGVAVNWAVSGTGVNGYKCYSGGVECTTIHLGLASQMVNSTSISFAKITHSPDVTLTEGLRYRLRYAVKSPNGPSVVGQVKRGNIVLEKSSTGSNTIGGWYQEEMIFVPHENGTYEISLSGPTPFIVDDVSLTEIGISESEPAPDMITGGDFETFAPSIYSPNDSVGIGWEMPIYYYYMMYNYTNNKTDSYSGDHSQEINNGSIYNTNNYPDFLKNANYYTLAPGKYYRLKYAVKVISGNCTIRVQSHMLDDRINRAYYYIYDYNQGYTTLSKRYISGPTEFVEYTDYFKYNGVEYDPYGFEARGYNLSNYAIIFANNGSCHALIDSVSLYRVDISIANDTPLITLQSPTNLITNGDFEGTWHSPVGGYNVGDNWTSNGSVGTKDSNSFDGVQSQHFQSTNVAHYIRTNNIINVSSGKLYLLNYAYKGNGCTIFFNSSTSKRQLFSMNQYPYTSWMQYEYLISPSSDTSNSFGIQGGANCNASIDSASLQELSSNIKSVSSYNLIPAGSYMINNSNKAYISLTDPYSMNFNSVNNFIFTSYNIFDYYYSRSPVSTSTTYQIQYTAEVESGECVLAIRYYNPYYYPTYSDYSIYSRSILPSSSHDYVDYFKISNRQQGFLVLMPGPSGTCKGNISSISLKSVDLEYTPVVPPVEGAPTTPIDPGTVSLFDIVGIGTDSPAAKLHVMTGAGDAFQSGTAAIFENGGYGDGVAQIILKAKDTGSGWTENNKFIRSEWGRLELGRYGDDMSPTGMTSSVQMAIDKNGNVGIGTFTPGVTDSSGVKLTLRKPGDRGVLELVDDRSYDQAYAGGMISFVGPNATGNLVTHGRIYDEFTTKGDGVITVDGNMKTKKDVNIELSRNIYFGQNSQIDVCYYPKGSCTLKGNFIGNVSVVKWYNNNLWVAANDGTNGRIYICDKQGNCEAPISQGYQIDQMEIFDEKIWLARNGPGGGVLDVCSGSPASCAHTSNAGNSGWTGTKILAMQVYENELWLLHNDSELDECTTLGVCTTKTTDLASMSATDGTMEVFNGRLYITRNHILSYCNSALSGFCDTIGSTVTSHIVSLTHSLSYLYLGQSTGEMWRCNLSNNCEQKLTIDESISDMKIYNNRLYISTYNSSTNNSIWDCSTIDTCMIILKGNSHSKSFDLSDSEFKITNSLGTKVLNVSDTGNIVITNGDDSWNLGDAKLSQNGLFLVHDLSLTDANNLWSSLKDSNKLATGLTVRTHRPNPGIYIKNTGGPAAIFEGEVSVNGSLDFDVMDIGCNIGNISKYTGVCMPFVAPQNTTNWYHVKLNDYTCTGNTTPIDIYRFSYQGYYDIVCPSGYQAISGGAYCNDGLIKQSRLLSRTQDYEDFGGTRCTALGTDYTKRAYRVGCAFTYDSSCDHLEGDTSTCYYTPGIITVKCAKIK